MVPIILNDEEEQYEERRVVLSQTLVREIQTVLCLAGPNESTVVLLRPWHRKPEATGARTVRAIGVFASFAVLVLAMGIILGH